MSSAKKLELFPEEQYIQDALRDGTCKLVAEYSMRALGTPDVRLQGRVLHLDMTHVKRLDQALQVNGNLHPVVVFEDPETGQARLGDGFHRHETYRRALRESIPAYVFVGTFADAAKFAAMCNQVSSLERTREDIEKVVWMLLDVEECRGWSASRIASHIGASDTTVRKYRLAYFAARDLTLPDKVEAKDGSLRKVGLEPGALLVSRNPRLKSKEQYSVRIDSKVHSLPTNREAAERERQRLLDEHEMIRALRWNLTDRRHVPGRFVTLGVFLQGACFKQNHHPGLWAYTGHGCVVVWTDLAARDSLPLHVGIVLLAREHVDPSARAVVVCYHEDAAPAVLDLGRALGVEFLTPEEFIASVGGSAEGATRRSLRIRTRPRPPPRRPSLPPRPTPSPPGA